MTSEEDDLAVVRGFGYRIPAFAQEDFHAALDRLARALEAANTREAELRARLELRVDYRERALAAEAKPCCGVILHGDDLEPEDDE